MTNCARIQIPGGPTVSGELRMPREGTGTGVVLGHGAGNDMTSPFLVSIADALAERGYATLRFNFPYKELGRKAPDPRPRLENAYLAAMDALRSQPGVQRLVIGGKSMGGRIASVVAAQGVDCDGLVFLGYPLHPAGRKEELRDDHLALISAPMLFVEGTRDPLCDLELLRPVLERLGSRADLHIVESGDHSFNVLKSTGRSREQVYEQITTAVADWLASRVDGKVSRSV